MIDFNKFECAIFDLDGTIIDSTSVWENVDIDFLAKRGLEVPKDYMHEIKMHNFVTGAQYTVKRFNLNEDPKDIQKEWFDMVLHQYSNHIMLKPFAKELLLHLRSKGIKLAIATSSDRTLFEPCLKRLAIYDYFDCFVQTSQVKRGKEFSDIYELAAKECNTEIEKCIVFEDILGAVKGAKNGGFYTVGVADDASIADRETIKAISDAFVENYEQIVNELKK